MSFTPPILPALDSKLALRLRACVDGKAKPLGSLGRMEDLAVQIGLIQNTETPRVEVVETYVFAGDHGLNAEGVSAYPSAVTAAMVATFLAGRANVNALSEACGVAMAVVDSGVDADLPAHPRLIDAKVRRGSRNAAMESALTASEVESALIRGGEIAAALILGLAPLPLFFPFDSAAQSIGLAALSTAGTAWLAQSLIGGFTGDVLGAVEQVAEVALLLGISARLAALWCSLSPLSWWDNNRPQGDAGYCSNEDDNIAARRHRWRALRCGLYRTLLYFHRKAPWPVGSGLVSAHL